MTGWTGGRIQYTPFIFVEWRLKKLAVEVLFWYHGDVIKWRHFPRYWPFMRRIYRSPVNSPHKGQWRGALMFSLIYAWINRWVNKGEAGDLRRFRAHYDGIVMLNTKETLHIFSHFPCNKRKWKWKIVWSRMIFPQWYFFINRMTNVVVHNQKSTSPWLPLLYIVGQLLTPGGPVVCGQWETWHRHDLLMSGSMLTCPRGKAGEN